MTNSRKDIDYYKEHVDDIIDLLYDKFYEPISHEQWLMDKSTELKQEAFYEWLNNKIYEANI